MKKPLLTSLLALLAMLLCAFAASPAPEAGGNGTMIARFITDIDADGSGSLNFEIELSQELMTLLKSYPGFDAEDTCSTFFEGEYDDWESTEQENDGALTCGAQTTFEDLEGLKDLIEDDLTGAHFSRLEIDGGHLYYDLVPNISGSAFFGEMGDELPFDLEVYWILKLPGDVVDSNASEKSGHTLTWDLLELNYASHIQAECEVGGGGMLGLDPTLTILLVLGLMGCCCMTLLVIGGAVFFFLRRKSPSPTEA